jgi:HSP20 family molecular chaperone IbpA
MDVVMEDGVWTIEAAVPGVPLENLKVEIEPYESDPTHYGKDGKRILRISGKMESAQRSEGAEYYKKELRKSNFERMIVLPEYIKGEPEALLKNGVLTLKWEVPELKKPEKKSIAIKCLDK